MQRFFNFSLFIGLVGVTSAAYVFPKQFIMSEQKNIQIYDTIILGAGLTGLSSAIGLLKVRPNSELLIIDRRPRVGGLVETHISHDGFLWEQGPNSFQPTPRFLGILKMLGIQDYIVSSDPSAPRYLLANGKLHELPLSLSAFMQFPLLSLTDKFKTIVGVLGMRPSPNSNEETLAEFSDRLSGSPTLRHVILQPFLSGVYAGDAQKISSHATMGGLGREDAAEGSLALAMLKRKWYGKLQIDGKRRKEGKSELDDILEEIAPSVKDLEKDFGLKNGALCSFKFGMQTIPTALAKYINSHYKNKHISDHVKLETEVRKISFVKGIWELELEDLQTKKKSTVYSKTIFSSLPSWEASKLFLSPFEPEEIKKFSTISSLLDSIHYPPIAEVVVAVHKSNLNTEAPPCININNEDTEESFSGCLKGFGQLISDQDAFDLENGGRIKTMVLGTIYASSLFKDNRAPEGYEVLVFFLGGDRMPQVKEFEKKQLVDAVKEFLDQDNSILKKGAPFKVLGVMQWDKSIPQYTIGHEKRIKQLDEVIESKFGDSLWLGGTWRDGVAVGDCLNSGFKHGIDIGLTLNGDHHSRY